MSARLLPSRLSLSVPESHRVGFLPLKRSKLLADCTAGGDFHPALKTSYFVVQGYYSSRDRKCNPQFSARACADRRGGRGLTGRGARGIIWMKGYRCDGGQPFSISIRLVMLTVRGRAERSARFWGEYVRQDDDTYHDSQESFPEVSHPAPTSLLREVADRRSSQRYLGPSLTWAGRLVNGGRFRPAVLDSKGTTWYHLHKGVSL